MDIQGAVVVVGRAPKYGPGQNSPALPWNTSIFLDELDYVTDDDVEAFLDLFLDNIDLDYQSIPLVDAILKVTFRMFQKGVRSSSNRFLLLSPYTNTTLPMMEIRFMRMNQSVIIVPSLGPKQVEAISATTQPLYTVPVIGSTLMRGNFLLKTSSTTHIIKDVKMGFCSTPSSVIKSRLRCVDFDVEILATPDGHYVESDNNKTPKQQHQPNAPRREFPWCISPLQRDVGKDLASKIARVFKERSMTKFSDVEVIVLLPDGAPVLASQIAFQAALASVPIKAFCLTRNFSKIPPPKDDVLRIVVMDMADFDPTNEVCIPEDGSVAVIAISSTPWNLQSKTSRIPKNNTVDYSPTDTSSSPYLGIDYFLEHDRVRAEEFSSSAIHLIADYVATLALTKNFPDGAVSEEKILSFKSDLDLLSRVFGEDESIQARLWQALYSATQVVQMAGYSIESLRRRLETPTLTDLAVKKLLSSSTPTRSRRYKANMVVLRVYDDDEGFLLQNWIRKSRDLLGMNNAFLCLSEQAQFEFFSDVVEEGFSSVLRSAIGDELDRFRTLHTEKREFVQSRVYNPTFSDLSDLPCLVLLCGQSRTGGENFPSSLNIVDLRLKNGGALVTWIRDLSPVCRFVSLEEDAFDSSKSPDFYWAQRNGTDFRSSHELPLIFINQQGMVSLKLAKELHTRVPSIPTSCGLFSKPFFCIDPFLQSTARRDRHRSIGVGEDQLFAAYRNEVMKNHMDYENGGENSSWFLLCGPSQSGKTSIVFRAINDVIDRFCQDKRVILLLLPDKTPAFVGFPYEYPSKHLLPALTKLSGKQSVSKLQAPVLADVTVNLFPSPEKTLFSQPSSNEPPSFFVCGTSVSISKDMPRTRLCNPPVFVLSYLDFQCIKADFTKTLANRRFFFVAKNHAEFCQLSAYFSTYQEAYVVFSHVLEKERLVHGMCAEFDFGTAWIAESNNIVACFDRGKEGSNWESCSLATMMEYAESFLQGGTVSIANPFCQPPMSCSLDSFFCPSDRVGAIGFASSHLLLESEKFSALDPNCPLYLLSNTSLPFDPTVSFLSSVSRQQLATIQCNQYVLSRNAYPSMRIEEMEQLAVKLNPIAPQFSIVPFPRSYGELSDWTLRTIGFLTGTFKRCPKTACVVLGDVSIVEREFLLLDYIKYLRTQPSVERVVFVQNKYGYVPVPPEPQLAFQIKNNYFTTIVEVYKWVSESRSSVDSALRASERAAISPPKQSPATTTSFLKSNKEQQPLEEEEEESLGGDIVTQAKDALLLEKSIAEKKLRKANDEILAKCVEEYKTEQHSNRLNWDIVTATYNMRCCGESIEKEQLRVRYHNNQQIRKSDINRSKFLLSTQSDAHPTSKFSSISGTRKEKEEEDEKEEDVPPPPPPQLLTPASETLVRNPSHTLSSGEPPLKRECLDVGVGRKDDNTQFRLLRQRENELLYECVDEVRNLNKTSRVKWIEVAALFNKRTNGPKRSGVELENRFNNTKGSRRVQPTAKV